VTEPAAAADPPPTANPPPLRERIAEVGQVMLRLGCTAFGGPAAHIAMLREEVVTRRRWVTDAELLDMISAANLVPGPTSTELALHLGMRRAGWAGFLIAGAGFILPAVLITLTLAWGYVRFGSLPAAHGLLKGLHPAVVALMLGALLPLARQAARTPRLTMLTGASLAAYLLSANEVGVLLGAGLVGILMARPPRLPPRAASIAWPVLAALGMGGGSGLQAGSVVLELLLRFLKIGATLFGSGYVLVAYAREELVRRGGLLTEQQLLDSIAAGQFTPGPLFTSATFMGYVAAGAPGAVAASLGIFMPSFLVVAATSHLVERMRSAAWSAGFMDGVNAASVALMGGVLLQLGTTALTNWPAWVIFVLALAATLRLRANSAVVVLAAAGMGLVLYR
jgi:chromate transporter